MQKRTIIGLWTIVILLLVILGNTLPTLEKTTEEQDYTYTHPKDDYTLEIKGYWQVYQEEEKKLILADTTNNATLAMTLEVGGYDYLTPKDTAEKLFSYLEKELGATDPQIIDGPTEGTVNGYSAVAFLLKLTYEEKDYYAEIAVVHPNEGIRLYSVFLYPKGTEKAMISQTETLINTLQFKDTEALYAKYMQE